MEQNTQPTQQEESDFGFELPNLFESSESEEYSALFDGIGSSVF